MAKKKKRKEKGLLKTKFKLNIFFCFDYGITAKIYNMP